MTINLVATRGEVLDLGDARVRIMEDGSHTHHRVGIGEEWLAPGMSGPPQHLNREHEETFVVVSGTVEFTSGHDICCASPGELVTALIGFFRDLARLTPGPDGLDPDDIAKVMARYATETWHP